MDILNKIECIKILKTSSIDRVQSLELLRDNLIAAGTTQSIEIWDLETFELVKTIKVLDSKILEVISFTLIACGGDNAIEIFDWDKNEKITTISGEGNISCFKVLSKKILITGLYNNEIVIRNLETYSTKKVFDEHSGKVSTLEIISDNIFASGSEDTTIKIWDIERQESLVTIEAHENEVRCLKKLSETLLASGSDYEEIKIWNLNNYECLNTLFIDNSSIMALELLNERLLISASIFGIHIWDLQTYECIQKFVVNPCFCIKIFRNRLLATGTDAGIFKLLSLKSYGMLASASIDCTVKLRNLDNLIPHQSIKINQNLNFLEIIDKKYILGGCLDGLKKCDIEKIKIFSIDTKKEKIDHLKIINNHTLIGSIEKNDSSDVKFWRLEDFSHIKTIENVHEGPITCLELVNKNILATTSEADIKLWSLANYTNIETISINFPVSCLKCINKHEIAACGSDSKIKIWNLDDLSSYSELEGHDKAINCLELINSFELVSGSDDNTIKIWDLRNYSCIRTLDSQKSPVSCLEVLNFNTIVSASKDGFFNFNYQIFKSFK